MFKLVYYDDKNNVYVCNVCGKVFTNYFQLNAHMFSSHRDLIDEELNRAMNSNINIESIEVKPSSNTNTNNTNNTNTNTDSVSESENNNTTNTNNNNNVDTSSPDEKKIRLYLSEDEYIEGNSYEELVYKLKDMIAPNVPDVRTFISSFIQIINQEEKKNYKVRQTYKNFLHILKKHDYIHDIVEL